MFSRAMLSWWTTSAMTWQRSLDPRDQTAMLRRPWPPARTEPWSATGAATRRCPIRRGEIFNNQTSSKSLVQVPDLHSDGAPGHPGDHQCAGAAQVSQVVQVHHRVPEEWTVENHRWRSERPGQEETWVHGNTSYILISSLMKYFCTAQLLWRVWRLWWVLSQWSGVLYSALASQNIESHQGGNKNLCLCRQWCNAY